MSIARPIVIDVAVTMRSASVKCNQIIALCYLQLLPGSHPEARKYKKFYDLYVDIDFILYQRNLEDATLSRLAVLAVTILTMPDKGR